ncbi:MAG: toxin TcdB middle/C-terminal domain-containing protein [Bacteroidia bacterium]
MPPIHKRHGFTNGYYQQEGKISRQYETEYYQGDTAAWLLSDTNIPDNLSPEEKREAARALKGRALRVEVYGLDSSPLALHPYTVSEAKFQIKTIQSKGPNRHASFYVCECESLNYQYERNPDDPRIAHKNTLEIDTYGNPLKTAEIVYPRRNISSHPAQNQIYITYTESEFINKDQEPDFYRIGVPYSQKVYEIHGLNLNQPFDKMALKAAISGASEIPFEAIPSGNTEKRLLNFTLTSFYKDDLSGELPFGDLDFHALPLSCIRSRLHSRAY